MKRKIFKYIFYLLDVQCESKMCNQAGTYENILSNYCQADFGKYWFILNHHDTCDAFWLDELFT